MTECLVSAPSIPQDAVHVPDVLVLPDVLIVPDVLVLPIVDLRGPGERCDACVLRGEHEKCAYGRETINGKECCKCCDCPLD
jgi:hypothetical protein